MSTRYRRIFAEEHIRITTAVTSVLPVGPVDQRMRIMLIAECARNDSHLKTIKPNKLL